MAIDVAIVVGHDLKSQGAKTADGITERILWGEWGPVLADTCNAEGISAECFFRDEEAGSWTERQIEIVKRVNAAKPRFVLALHFNAYKGTTQGVKALHYPGSANGERLATVLTKAIARAQKTKARLPPYAMRESWAGTELFILSRTLAPATILEPFFGDNEDDTAAGMAGLESGATVAAIVDALRGLLGRAPMV